MAKLQLSNGDTFNAEYITNRNGAEFYRLAKCGDHDSCIAKAHPVGDFLSKSDRPSFRLNGQPVSLVETWCSNVDQVFDGALVERGDWLVGLQPDGIEKSVPIISFRKSGCPDERVAVQKAQTGMAWSDLFADRVFGR